MVVCNSKRNMQDILRERVPACLGDIIVCLPELEASEFSDVPNPAGDRNRLRLGPNSIVLLGWSNGGAP